LPLTWGKKVMLKVEGLSAAYGSIRVLHEISLQINDGEIVCLLGANGAGKSTLLKTLSGVLPPSKGKVIFAGQEVTSFPPDRLVRLGLCHVPEGKQLFPSLTVLENLRLGAYCHGSGAAQVRMGKDLEKVFSLFPRLAERKSQKAGTLSGGEQQMLAIGRGLMGRPRLLLLDEPSLGLAPLLIKGIFQTIRDLRDEGITIFLVEQNVRMALEIADRGYVLQTGRVVLEGGTQWLLANDSVQSAYLGTLRT